MWTCPRTRLFASFLLLTCLGLIGCGSGTSLTGSGAGLGDNSKNALLQGQYAFALSGQSNGTPFFAVGGFTADGQGHLGGNEDVNGGTNAVLGTAAHFGGSYAIGADGRGNAVVGLQPGCPNWQITMISHAHALLTCLNSNVTGSGTIDLQDPNSFNAAALKGNYVFGFSGLGSSGFSAAMAGTWSMSGAGEIPTGETDVNDLGATPFEGISLSGTYSVDSTGRGKATISSNYGTQNFVFYVVNATDCKLLEIDPAPVVSGELLRQEAGPFTAASFNGTYPFTRRGGDGNGNPLALGGLLPANGSGSIASGILDTNYAGNIALGNTVAGAYSMSPTGRGFATLSSSLVAFPVAFYQAANGTVDLVSMGGSIAGTAFVVSGMAEAQASGPFANNSLSGNYAVNFSGTNLGSAFAGPGEEDISGQLSADGAGNLSGTLDINNSGSIFQSLTLSSSSYSLGPTGRGTATLNAANSLFSLQTYQIDRNTVLFLDADTNRVMTGIGQKQQF